MNAPPLPEGGVVDSRPPRRLLRLEHVIARTTLPKSTIYMLINQGAFPAPKQLTRAGGAVAWHESEVEAWMDSLPAAVPEGARQWQAPPAPTSQPPVPQEKPRRLSIHGRVIGRPRKTDRTAASEPSET